jgi:hypothetical protein
VSGSDRCSAGQSTARELFLTTGRSSAIVVSQVWPVHVHVAVECRFLLSDLIFFVCVLHSWLCLLLKIGRTSPALVVRRRLVSAPYSSRIFVF